MAAGTDLFVAGWNYGMRPGGDVTPATLAEIGIPTLVLTETCRRAGNAGVPITLDALLYADEERLGAVFGRAPQARQLIAEWRARIASVRKRLVGTTAMPVFLYDSGQDAPFTAGRDALATELIRLGGGRNIFSDLPTNWGRASWESAAARGPEAIILVDYGTGTDAARARLAYDPLMAATPALRHNRVLTLHYDALTPGPADIDAVETIARFLHPDRMP